MSTKEIGFYFVEILFSTEKSRQMQFYDEQFCVRFIGVSFCLYS